MKCAIGVAVALAACGQAHSRIPAKPPDPPAPTSASPSSEPGTRHATVASAPPAEKPRTLPLVEIPVGIASAGVHVARGLRQPLEVRSTVAAILPESSEAATPGWSTIEFSAPERRQLRLLLTPSSVPLPFAAGDFVSADVDCRKGGWSRICDAVFRDRNRRLYLAIAGSGDPRLLADWHVKRGPLSFSEARAKGPKSVRHTYSVIFEHARQSVTVSPHEWQRLLTNDGAWLVEGHAVSWEGSRPLEAPDYVHYAIVRVR